MLTDLILSITIFKKSTLLCECKGYQLISVFWERKKNFPITQTQSRNELRKARKFIDI